MPSWRRCVPRSAAQGPGRCSQGRLRARAARPQITNDHPASRPAGRAGLGRFARPPEAHRRKFTGWRGIALRMALLALPKLSCPPRREPIESRRLRTNKPANALVIALGVIMGDEPAEHTTSTVRDHATTFFGARNPFARHRARRASSLRTSWRVMSRAIAAAGTGGSWSNLARAKRTRATVSAGVFSPGAAAQASGRRAPAC